MHSRAKVALVVVFQIILCVINLPELSQGHLDVPRHINVRQGGRLTSLERGAADPAEMAITAREADSKICY